MNVRRLLRWGAIAAVIVLCVLAWRAAHEPGSRDAFTRWTTPVAIGAPTAPQDDGRPQDARAQAHAHADQRQVARDVDRARRDALHQRIVERQRNTARPSSATTPTRPTEPAESDIGDQGPGLTNRMGDGFDGLVAAVNHEFLSLAHECIEQAIARAPALQGMLAIEITAIGDEELGAVIDAVEFPAANEVLEPELLECVRESSFSMSLPPPPQGGRTAFSVTMPVGDGGEG